MPTIKFDIPPRDDGKKGETKSYEGEKIKITQEGLSVDGKKVADVPQGSSFRATNGGVSMSIGNLRVGGPRTPEEEAIRERGKEILAAGREKLEKAREERERARGEREKARQEKERIREEQGKNIQNDPNTIHFDGNVEIIGNRGEILVDEKSVDPNQIPGMKVTKDGNKTNFEVGNIHSSNISFVGARMGGERPASSVRPPQPPVSPVRQAEPAEIKGEAPSSASSIQSIPPKVETVVASQSQAPAPSPAEEVKQQPPRAKSVLEGGDRFVTSSVNRTDVIRGLKEIGGTPIGKLEQSMRKSTYNSFVFLGPKESLVDVLSSDNELVLSQGLRHQDIAEALSQAVRIAKDLMPNTSQPAWLANAAASNVREFEYQGGTYSVKTRKSGMGTPRSPFKDYETDVGSREITVTNMATGVSINFNDLMALLIKKYGFYGGKEKYADIKFRVDPMKIIEVFKHLKELGEKRLAEQQERKE